MTAEVLTVRALNRATLARQLLLERASVSPSHAVRHLVGLQAQIPNNPYVGLWSRLAGFDPMSVSDLVHDRMLVRLTVMRGTLHLVTADDCLLLRPLMQPVLDDERRHHRDFAPFLEGVDLEPVIGFGREVLSDRALSGTELRVAMQERFPDLDAGALAFACRSGLALVQVPPRGEWGRSSQVRVMTAEAFLGRPVEAAAIDRRRGAALPRLRSDLRPRATSRPGAGCAGWPRWSNGCAPGLRVFRNERGRELFDLPEAPRPDPDVPAPIRFLPEYDNLWLAHDDRSRVLTEDGGRWMQLTSAPFRGSVLIDGWLRASWHLEGRAKDGKATLFVAADGPAPEADDRVGVCRGPSTAQDDRRTGRRRQGVEVGRVNGVASDPADVRASWIRPSRATVCQSQRDQLLQALTEPSGHLCAQPERHERSDEGDRFEHGQEHRTRTRPGRG